MSESEQESSIISLDFFKREFWDNFYKNHNPKSPYINWYFDITKLNIDNFSLSKIQKEEDILLIGPGLSSILDYFYENDYEKITIYDYSDELVKILNDKYKGWSIDCYDIVDISESFSGGFNIIIDKGCLDCVLSEPKRGQSNFIKAFNNILSLLSDDGIFYYFSTSNERENLMRRENKIKCIITKIDMNKDMGEQYKQFKQEDNIYFLYTIQKY